MKFGGFFVGEYLSVGIASGFISTLFLGGYLGPFEGMIGVEQWPSLYQTLWGIGWFSVKMLFMIFVFLWVRWTLPRFKYNQLMHIGWKRFIPIALVNLMLMPLVAYLVKLLL
jgi:NADH-quinone oxidoreductase subunit H